MNTQGKLMRFGAALFALLAAGGCDYLRTKPCPFRHAAEACAAACPADADGTLAAFPRRAGETDDAPRVQRAIDAFPSGVLSIPAGRYAIARTLVVTNMCSLRLHKNAVLAAVEPMDFGRTKGQTRVIQSE